MLHARFLHGLDLPAAFGHFASTPARLAASLSAIPRAPTALMICPIRADRSNPLRDQDGKIHSRRDRNRFNRRERKWPQPPWIEQRRAALTGTGPPARGPKSGDWRPRILRTSS